MSSLLAGVFAGCLTGAVDRYVTGDVDPTIGYNGWRVGPGWSEVAWV